MGTDPLANPGSELRQNSVAGSGGASAETSGQLQSPGSGPFFGEQELVHPSDVDRKHRPDPLSEDFAIVPRETHRVRIRFSKQGDLRMIGHRDLQRMMERLFRRAGVTVALSEGFHPKPRMMFPSALALGVAGLNEPLEVDLAAPMNADELLARLNAASPPGLAFQSLEEAPPGAKKGQALEHVFELHLPPERCSEVADKARELLADPDRCIQRADQASPLAVRSFVSDLLVEGDVLRMRLRISQQASVRPRDVLAELGWSEEEIQQLPLVRTAVDVRWPQAAAT